MKVKDFRGFAICDGIDGGGFSAENPDSGEVLQRDSIPALELAIDAYWTSEKKL